MSGIAFLQMKIDRAEVHLNEIEKEHKRLVDDGLYAITKKDNSKKQRHIIRLESISIDPLLPMLVGEFAYCLRSGLDQLAWQLALLNLKTKRPKSQTSFPIRGKRPDPKSGFGDVMKDILPAAVTVIESLQPYNRTDSKIDPLWILNKLCITDKHVILALNSTDSRFRIRNASSWTRRDLNYAVEITVPLTDKLKVKIEPEKSEIVFGEPIGSLSSGFEVRVGKLRPIHDYVRNDVLPRFAGFFK